MRPSFASKLAPVLSCWTLAGCPTQEAEQPDEGEHAQWDAIVRGGIYEAKGMPKFDHLMSEEQSAAIQQYIIKRAVDTRPAEAAAGEDAQ